MRTRVTRTIRILVITAVSALCWLACDIAATGPLSLAREEKMVVANNERLNSIRGVIKPLAEATLSSQIQGRISRLAVRDGERFSKDDLLVALDCAKYEAELEASRAEHQGKRKTLDNNLGLAELKAIGNLEVEVSAAEEQKAQAAVRVAEVMVRGCRIQAPFSGRVVTVKVNEHENVFPNDELMSILDDSKLQIELIMPSKALGWVRRGSPFLFVVDETKRNYHATVKEIGASVDPASQTVRIIGVFKRPPADVLAGMSGTAAFRAGQDK
jgi:membrane fusion protein (multidrug efflux system)